MPVHGDVSPPPRDELHARLAASGGGVGVGGSDCAGGMQAEGLAQQDAGLWQESLALMRHLAEVKDTLGGAVTWCAPRRAAAAATELAIPAPAPTHLQRPPSCINQSPSYPAARGMTAACCPSQDWRRCGATRRV